MSRRFLMRVLWPSFLAAGITSAIVFAVVDPLDIRFLGHLQIDRQVVYAVGFFLFWLMAAISSALSLLIGQPAKNDISPLLGNEQDADHDI